MSLSEIMSVTNNIPSSLQKSLGIEEKFKIGMSPERFATIKDNLRQYISFWRDYPDMFVDFLQTGTGENVPQEGLHFFFYQRVFLRACLR